MLEIAGTSCGGSSYMARIVRALNKNGKGDLVVRIGKGPKQYEVHRAILQCKKDLTQLMGTVPSFKVVLM